MKVCLKHETWGKHFLKSRSFRLFPLGAICAAVSQKMKKAKIKYLAFD